ncbi:S8 family serine peptidase [Fulvivirga kasyanovii]|uniref:S8 family serine peptidase n=1 Tax=Fulvivirga kasyanovii TaxID=396812 RepID=UPI0031DBFB1B
MIRKKALLNCFVFVLMSITTIAQDKYWIFFNNKNVDREAQYVSDRTLYNRAMLGIDLFQETDAPVNKAYIDSLKSYHINVITTSKWLNGITAVADQHDMAQIKHLGFVKSVQPLTSRMFVTGFGSDVDFYSYAMNQIAARKLIERGLTGKGIQIGVIDGNFFTSDRSPALKQLFENGQVAATRDFVDPDSKEFFNNADNQNDYHGTAVWHMIGGFDSLKNMQYGLATGASYYLARTDDTYKEMRLEEAYWIEALEWMDSLGVRLVNSSLGYATDFDDKKENYDPEDMNGKTTSISKAAQIATTEKGMVLVIAAGNRGADKSWKVVSAPADAEGVITIGATDIIGKKEEFSAIGPAGLSYTKPDFACLAANGGTSIAAPVITGLIACLMEVKPTLSSKQIKEILRKASHLYPFPNTYLGYGIPSADEALEIIKGAGQPNNNVEEITVEGKKTEIELTDTDIRKVVVFHKSDGSVVIEQEVLSVDNNILQVKKPSKAGQSTLVLEDKLIEITWK